LAELFDEIFAWLRVRKMPLAHTSRRRTTQEHDTICDLQGLVDIVRD
jgi:hypothetical protein